jgi:hypothetical protein
LPWLAPLPWLALPSPPILKSGAAPASSLGGG